MLTKIAFYGGIATFSSCYFMHFKIQSMEPFNCWVNHMSCVAAKLCSGHYYTHAVQALMSNQTSRDLLGNPVQAHKINLFYTYNVITPKTAKVDLIFIISFCLMYIVSHSTVLAVKRF